MNIADCRGRSTRSDFRRFLDIAMGSASEVEYLILSCQRPDLLSAALAAELTDNVIQIKPMLAGLIQRASDNKRPPM
jgi:four helix bundle protein